MVIAVEYSAIAGGTGTRSRGLSLERTESFCPIDLALLNSMSRREAPFEYWMGTLLRDSAPPARTTSHSPLRMASAPEVMALLDEAQARLTVVPGIVMGSDTLKTTSLPRLGACRAWTTTPKMERSISSGSMAVRATSSAAATPARSTTSMSWRSVPDFEKGVRQPSTMATLPPTPRALWLTTLAMLGAWSGPRVQTVSARSWISSWTVARLGGGRTSVSVIGSSSKRVTLPYTAALLDRLAP